MTENAPDNRRAVAASRDLRRARTRRLAIGFAIWVGLPTLVATIYYGLIATPQFESSAVVMIESNERGADSGESDGWLPHAGTSRDVKVTREYIRSRAMLAKLIKEQGFVEHYSADTIDRWSRLAAGAGAEARYAYFQDKVAVTGDTTSGTATLAVKAFSAAQAQKLARAILANAEKGMNEQSSRAWADQVSLGEVAVKEAKARVARIRDSLSQLGVKAPVGLAPAAGTPGTSPAPAVPDLKLDGASGRQAEVEVEALLLERDLALRELESALKGLEAARASSARDRRYLIAVAEPSLPDEAAFPRRLWSIATVFFSALSLAGVLSLLVAAVREHAKL